MRALPSICIQSDRLCISIPFGNVWLPGDRHYEAPILHVSLCDIAMLHCE
jgi:hypothetical protein